MDDRMVKGLTSRMDGKMINPSLMQDRQRQMMDGRMQHGYQLDNMNNMDRMNMDRMNMDNMNMDNMNMNNMQMRNMENLNLDDGLLHERNTMAQRMEVERIPENAMTYFYF